MVECPRPAEKPSKVDSGGMPDSVQEPEKEFSAAQQRISRDQPIEVGLGTQYRSLFVLSKKGKNKDGKGGEEQVVQGQVGSVKKRLDREARVKGVDQLVGENCNVLVEEILNKHRDPVVIPVTMDKESALQKFEFREGKVRSFTCCTSFVPDNTYSNMCFLDHRNVVFAISNSSS